MSWWLQQRVEQIFSWGKQKRAPSRKIIMLGLDAAGKTTLLHRLRCPGAEVETSIPTIGFNVETLQQDFYSIVCWDVGGCDKIRPLWRHYIEGTDLLIWVVDSNDQDRLGDTRDELNTFLMEFKDKSPNIRLLVVANKQDLPSSLPTDDVIKSLKLHSLRKIPWKIVPAVLNGSSVNIEEIRQTILSFLKCSANSLQILQEEIGVSIDDAKEHGGEDSTTAAATGVILDSSTATAATACEEVVSTVAHWVVPGNEEIRSNDVLRTLLVRDWINRDDYPCDELLQRLADCTLEEWDHYAHIRIAWVFIHRYGESKGFEYIATSIKSFIAHQNENRKDCGEGLGPVQKRFHCTMTYFWCYIVNHAMKIHELQSKEHVNKEGKGTEDEEFKSFLWFVVDNSSVCPPLWDKALYKHYYSTGVMFSNHAREISQQPDLRPLPSLAAPVDT